MILDILKIRYCAEKIFVQILSFYPTIYYEAIISQFKPLKHVKYLNDKICIPIIISNLKPDEEGKLKELFSIYLNKLKDVQLSDLETLSSINWTRFISPMEENFEDIARWNRNMLLGLSPPPWMAPEEINATVKEIEELSKNNKTHTRPESEI